MKLVPFVVVLLLLSPLLTTMLDSVCWFYISTTCSGIVYDTLKIGVMFVSTVSAGLLLMLIVG